MEAHEKACGRDYQDKFVMPEYSVENVTRGLTLASFIRLASGSADRRRGLLGVSEFAPGSGLWIDPCEAIHTFGMQVALDAVFLDSKLRVKKVRSDLKPGRIAMCLTATSVLELKAGTVMATSTQPGDQLSFRSIETREAAQETDSGSR